MTRRVLAATAATVAAVLALTLTACGDDDPAGVSVTAGPTTSAAPANGTELAAADFAAALKREGTTILDVRTPAEYAEGHLEGAVNLDVENGDFADRAAALDPAGRYAVYCRSGNRSGVAVQALLGAGFVEVYHLAGGIQAWADAGGATVTD